MPIAVVALLRWQHGDRHRRGVLQRASTVQGHFRQENAQHCEPSASSSKSSTPSSLEARKHDYDQSSVEAQLHFERNGFLKCSNLLSQAEVLALRHELLQTKESKRVKLAAYKHQVRIHLGPEVAKTCRTREQCIAALRPFAAEGYVSFLQYFNLHRRNCVLRSAALSPRLGLWARRLLGVSRVRLYQDALFEKRPGDGPTHWHSDCRLSPFDTNQFVTIWLPLRPIARGSGLTVAVGSHKDFSLAMLGDPEGDLDDRYDEVNCSPLALGDASFHHGWALHAASPLPFSSKTARHAWALSYVADGAKLRVIAGMDSCEDAESYKAWIRDIPAGGVVEHPMLPLVDDDHP